VLRLFQDKKPGIPQRSSSLTMIGSKSEDFSAWKAVAYSVADDIVVDKRLVSHHCEF